MGHRANFVVIRDGRAQAYYDNWAALGCAYTFGAGPDEACEALAECEPTDALLDWAFAEGGYLIDFDEKKAIVFGSLSDPDEFAAIDEEAEEPSEEPGLSLEQDGRGFLQQIAPRWAGWRLVWDDHGVDAFAAHLRNRSITGIAVQPDSHPPETSKAIEIQA